MFQSFDDPTHDEGAERLTRLRAAMAEAGLDGFLVPRADRHQGEYVPARDERLRWLTGFTGSAGFCVVLADRAAVFVDGRYTLQAEAQLDPVFERERIETTRPEAWLAEAAGSGAIIGYDPWLHTEAGINRFDEALKKTGAELRPVPDNPVDAIWPDQPTAPAGALRAHPVNLAGRESADKREACAGTLREEGAGAFVLTAPDSLAWLLNIRGGDVAHNPVALAFGVLRDDGSVALYADDDRVDGALRDHLGPQVVVRPPGAMLADLTEFAGRTVGLAKGSAPRALADTLREAGATVHWMADPCVLPKARKNETELEGAREAHRRDGAALTRFLCWLDGASGITEIDAARRLEAFRAETGVLEDISFDTISAAGPNAALPHYRVSRASNRAIEPGTLYLSDSGGQYRDGTTDVTRTVAVGTPRPDHVRAFTLVLRGMIEVGTARFPEGTTGVQIDALARAALWRAGLDFDHGTGHGVGAFLSVHEGPVNLSRRGTVALEPGMIVSDEPGYYREGDFGIRIENLVAVNQPSVPEGGERAMMSFETLTLAPIDIRLVDPALLGPEGCIWLDAYHQRVYEALFPLLDGETQEWLAEATRAVSG